MSLLFALTIELTKFSQIPSAWNAFPSLLTCCCSNITQPSLSPYKNSLTNTISLPNVSPCIVLPHNADLLNLFVGHFSPISLLTYWGQEFAFGGEFNAVSPNIWNNAWQIEHVCEIFVLWINELMVRGLRLKCQKGFRPFIECLRHIALKLCVAQRQRTTL